MLQKREFISQRTQKRNKIHRIDFSDPQGGIGAADRLAATCKSHVRLFINEGNDVTTAHQLKDALLSHGGIDGVRVVAMETTEDLVEDSRKIPTISKLNNFAFHDDSITAYSARMTLERVKRSYWKRHQQVTVNENIFGVLFICCLLAFF